MPPKRKSKGGFSIRKLIEPADRILAVDVGSRFVKIALLRRRKEGFGVSALDAERIPYVSSRGDITPVQVKEALQTVLQRNGLKSGSFISILPREFCTIKRFELPSADRAQIEQMVPFEAEKHLPFAIERAVFDFHMQPLGAAEIAEPEEEAAAEPPAAETEQQESARKTAEAMAAAGGSSVITLAAVRQAVINRLLELLQLRGFRQHAITVAPFALYNAFNYWARSEGVALSGDTAMIDIGARRTEVIVIAAETGELVFSRALAFGGDKLTEHIAREQELSFEEAERVKCERWDETCFYAAPRQLEELLSPFVEQVRTTLNFIVRQGLSSGIGAVWLAGGTANVPGLADRLHGALDVPVTLFDPVSAIGGGGRAAVPASSLSAVIGAALRTVDRARMVIDLLPVDVTKLQAQAQRLRRLMQLGIAAAVIVVLGLGVFGARVLMASIERRQLFAELRRLIPAEERVKQFEERNEVLRVAVQDMAELTETRTSWSRVFQSIADCMGSNVWIKKITVNRRNQMTLDAGSLGVNDLIDFKNAMDGSARFDNVEVGNEARQQQGNIVFRQFRLTCDVLPDYRYYERLDALKRQLENAMGTAVAVSDTRSIPPLAPDTSNLSDRSNTSAGSEDSNQPEDALEDTE